jgi:bacteriocin-like protein
MTNFKKEKEVKTNLEQKDQKITELSDEDLENVVGGIALYPDSEAEPFKEETKEVRLKRMIDEQAKPKHIGGYGIKNNY